MNMQQLKNLEPGQVLLDGIYQHEIVYVRQRFRKRPAGLFLRTLGSNRTFWILTRDVRKLKLSPEPSPTKVREAIVMLERRLLAAGVSREVFLNLLADVAEDNAGG
jgi:hypothetical protein